jgi:hypothetical protein
MKLDMSDKTDRLWKLITLTDILIYLSAKFYNSEHMVVDEIAVNLSKDTTWN